MKCTYNTIYIYDIRGISASPISRHVWGFQTLCTSTSRLDLDYLVVYLQTVDNRSSRVGSLPTSHINF